MGRYARATRIQSREIRRTLSPTKEPIWHEVRRGLCIGYYRGRKTGTWWLREHVDGRRIKRRLGRADDEQFADGRTVLSFVDALRLATAESRPTTAPAATSYTLNDALDDYFASREARSSPASVRSDQHSAAKNLRPKLGRRQAASLSTEDLVRWRDGLVVRSEDPEARRRSQVTANRNWAVLRACLNFAFIRDKISSSDPWLRVRPFRNVERARQRFLTIDECNRLIAVCDADFRPLVQGALFTGLRLGELLEVRHSDLRGSCIHIEHSKSGKPRDVPLSPQGRQFFEQLARHGVDGAPLLLQPNETEWIKMTISRRMRAASLAAKLSPPARFHDLRRSYGSLLLNAGVPIEVIRDLLGHSDMRMTLRSYSFHRAETLQRQVAQHLPDFGQFEARHQCASSIDREPSANDELERVA